MKSNPDAWMRTWSHQILVNLEELSLGVYPSGVQRGKTD
jgi:hypothetical protein